MEILKSFSFLFRQKSSQIQQQRSDEKLGKELIMKKNQQNMNLLMKSDDQLSNHKIIVENNEITT